MRKLFLTHILFLIAAFFIGNSYAITVKQVGQVADDTAITAQIKAQYAQDKLLDSFDIHVATKQNIVYLSGTVETDMQYEKAVTIAESTDSVDDVNANGLKVKDSKSPLSDTLITAKIKGLILKDKTLNTATRNSDVSVETKDGVVYLSGTVSSSDQKNYIQKLVKSVKNVKNVNSDDLNVE